MNTPKALSNLQGFTLIELIVTITVIAIIASIAVPAMQSQIAAMRLKDSVNSMELALKEARTQALINQRPTQIVLDNKAADTDKNLMLSFIGDNSSLSQYTLSKKIAVSTNPATLTTIVFMPKKQVLQGALTQSQIDNPPADAALNGTADFSFCYPGQISKKYTVSVDANANILTNSAGSCT